MREILLPLAALVFAGAFVVLVATIVVVLVGAFGPKRGRRS